MNYFLIQALPIADIGNEESNFLMQILVFLLLAVFCGVYSLVKNNRSKYKDQQRNHAEQSHTHYAKSRWRFLMPHKLIAPRKGIVQEYITKMKHTQHHTPSLPQEPKLDFDTIGQAGREKPKNKPATEKNKDLRSGMDLLELDSLLSIVENIKGNDQNDVTMRKLNFNEVLRREKLSQVNSKVLTVYAINQSNLYGKDIQCEAMGELAERTMHTNRHEAPKPAVVPKRKRKIVDVK